MWFLLLFLVLPLVEIVLFIQVGGAIGVLPTLLLILLSIVVGVLLLRSLGPRTSFEVRRALAEHTDPSRPVLEGFFTLAAAILLILPGFLTDAIGLLMLIGPLRNAVGRLLWRVAERSGRFTVVRAGQGRGTAQRPGVIDAEYSEIREPGSADEPAPPTELPPSKWRRSG